MARSDERGQRLLDEYVLARAQRAHRQVVMRGHGSGDRNGIDALVVQHLVEVLGLADGGEAPPEIVEQIWSQIAHPSGVRRGRLVDHAKQVGSPVPEPYDPDAHAAAPPFLGRSLRGCAAPCGLEPA